MGGQAGASRQRQMNSQLKTPAVAQVCAELAAQHGIAMRASISDTEIVERCLYPLINEAAAILKLVHAHMAAGDRFSNSLAEADLKLPQMDGNAEKVRALVKFLISENAKMQQEQAHLQLFLFWVCVIKSHDQFPFKVNLVVLVQKSSFRMPNV